MENALTSQTSKPASSLIFIVDDEPAVLQVLEICLRKAGYEVRSFDNPLEALRTLEMAPRKPDLLTTDYQMPGLDGMELIERCKASHPALKTICVSGSLSYSEMATFDIRPDRFINKPFSPREVVGVVKELLAPAP